MADMIFVATVVVLGLVVPFVVFGLMVAGRARFGDTATVTASWTLCTALIALYRYATVGIDEMFLAALILMAESIWWTWSYRDHLIGRLFFSEGGMFQHHRLPPDSVAAILPRAGESPDGKHDTASCSRKENE